jgi:hypothetical protein
MGEWRYSSTILDPVTTLIYVASFMPGRFTFLHPLDSRLGGPHSTSGYYRIKKTLLPLSGIELSLIVAQLVKTFLTFMGPEDSLSKLKVMLRQTVSKTVSLGVKSTLGLVTRYYFLSESCCVVSVGRPL